MPTWIDKELKKRSGGLLTAASSLEPATGSPQDPMGELWKRLEQANEVLPDALRLKAVDGGPPPLTPDPLQPVHFLAWLRAPNGAALGFSGDAVRYIWPQRAFKRSRNFWIRWTAERGFYVQQRLGAANVADPHSAESSFDPRRADEMVRRLVTGKRITPGAIRKRWLGFL